MISRKFKINSENINKTRQLTSALRTAGARIAIDVASFSFWVSWLQERALLWAGEDP